ncbi:MAG: hypothetical protein ATN31_00175 [Candidatus Epulonipiscioides saccharophilum]|nr:MAG: hypothetical protein ATN31_00175 [Epulopiscium sp. AS2M-Bin001]
MREFKLENYMEELNKQVIHMDQAVCYCPEFRATRMMNQYPSRRLQIARAILKGEMELSDYAGKINFFGILSRQGERWQNFGECPADCTDITILARAMLLEKGYNSPSTNAFKEALKNGTAFEKATWNLPVSEDSKVAILLDSDTANICGAENSFNEYCKKNNIAFVNNAEAEFIGFEYFAYGLVEEGIAHVKSLVDKYNNMNIDKVLVLSAKAAYVLRWLVKRLDIHPNFEVEYLPEKLSPMPQKERTYVYSGSFNTRYLMNSDLINDLIPAEDNTQIPTSQEFIPLLKGNSRANKLTIWQKPISAEYKEYAFCDKMADAIKADALKDIKAAEASQIVVFEPTAYKTLKQEFPDTKVIYYLNLL